jgi:hypothetical protein
MQTVGPRLAASVPVDSERRRGRIAMPVNFCRNFCIFCDKYMHVPMSFNLHFSIRSTTNPLAASNDPPLYVGIGPPKHISICT